MSVQNPIKWTPEEYATAIAAFKAAQDAGEAVPAAMKTAMQAIPPKRRRPLTGGLRKHLLEGRGPKKWDETGLGESPPDVPAEPPAVPDPLPRSKKTNIVWTETERAMVCLAYKQVKAANPKMVTPEAARQAMLVLPEARRRPVHVALGAELNQFVRAERAKAAQLPSPPPPPPVVIETPPEVVTIPPASFASSVSVTDTPSVAEAIVHEIVQNGAAILAGILQHPAVKDAMAGLIGDFFQAQQPAEPEDWSSSAVIKHNGMQQQPEKERKPRVLVAGMIAKQEREIERRFADKYDLRFWQQGKSMDVLRRMADVCDYAMAFTGFVGHSTTQVIQSRAQRYIPVSGGVTAMIHALEDLPIPAPH